MKNIEPSKIDLQAKTLFIFKKKNENTRFNSTTTDTTTTDTTTSTTTTVSTISNIR